MLIDITEQQLQDFIYCPIYYAFRYNSKLKIKKPPTVTKLLSRVAQGFCSDLKDGKIQSLHLIKRKWSMYCNQYPEIINDSANRHGIDLLYKMYLWAEEQELVIAAIGTPYNIKVKFNNDIIVYHGQLNIISANKNKYLENLILDFNQKPPDQANIDLSLKTSLDYIGFNTLYENNLQGTRVHHVKTNNDYFTGRNSKSEMSRVATIIQNVVKSIQQNIWYPKESILCSNCVTRDFCLLYGKKGQN